MAVCQQLKFAVFHDYCDITERRIYWSLKNCCSSSRHEARAATKVGPEGLWPPPKICWRCPCTRLVTNVTEFKKHVHSLLHFFLKQTLDSFPLHKNSADDFFLNITEWVIGLFWDTVVQMKANLELQAPTKTMVMTKTQIFKLWNEQSKTTEWHHGGYWKWGQ